MAGLIDKNRAERIEIMNENSRVLGRVGARELTTREVERVQGGIIIHTNTACFRAGGMVSSDSAPYECGSDNPF